MGDRLVEYMVGALGGVDKIKSIAAAGAMGGGPTKICETGSVAHIFAST